MLTIDGSQGEGGGQILRTSLALSLATGRPLRIERIRAGRERPGLMRQHLTAVLAAAEISSAEVHGAHVGSTELSFAPGKVRAGEYRFAIGTAGSTTMVLQAILPPLLLADGPSVVTLQGGTHARHAPPFDFFERALVPLMNRMGARIEAAIERHGFYPAGGGRITVRIEPGPPRPLVLEERGEIIDRHATALISQLGRTIAERELAVVREKLGWERDRLRIRQPEAAAGPGNTVMIEVRSEQVTELFTAFGEVGKAAERVASEAVDEARAYLAADVPVGPHLADQLLTPMALLGGGSFVTSEPTRHTMTNAQVIEALLGIAVRLEQAREGRWRVTVGA